MVMVRAMGNNKMGNGAVDYHRNKGVISADNSVGGKFVMFYVKIRQPVC